MFGTVKVFFESFLFDGRQLESLIFLPLLFDSSLLSVTIKIKSLRQARRPVTILGEFDSQLFKFLSNRFDPNDYLLRKFWK